MRHALAPELERRLCDAPALAEAAAAREVGLDDVEAAAHHPVAERPDRGLVLGRRDLQRAGLAEPAVAVDVLDRERLLEPVEVVLGEAPRHLERVLELPAAPDVDHHVDVRPGRLARRRHELDVAARVESERAPAELERAVAALDLRRHVAPHRVRRLGHQRARVDAHACRGSSRRGGGGRAARARARRGRGARCRSPRSCGSRPRACRRGPSSRRGRARSARCRTDRGRAASRASRRASSATPACR